MTAEQALRLAKKYAEKWQFTSNQSTGPGEHPASPRERRDVILQASHCEQITLGHHGEDHGVLSTTTMWRVNNDWAFNINESTQSVHIQGLKYLRHLIR